MIYVSDIQSLLIELHFPNRTNSFCCKGKMFSIIKQISVRKILSFSARNLANQRDDFVMRMKTVYVGNIQREKMSQNGQKKDEMKVSD